MKKEDLWLNSFTKIYIHNLYRFTVLLGTAVHTAVSHFQLFLDMCSDPHQKTWDLIFFCTSHVTQHYKSVTVAWSHDGWRQDLRMENVKRRTLGDEPIKGTTEPTPRWTYDLWDPAPHHKPSQQRKIPLSIRTFPTTFPRHFQRVSYPHTHPHWDLLQTMLKSLPTHHVDEKLHKWEDQPLAL